MTTTDPYARFGTKQTPQNQQVPGLTQVKNNAGGFVFEIDPLSQFKRFLTIGTSGGTYYVSEHDLTAENANLVLELTKSETMQKQATDVLVELSLGGRTLKQNPVLFALAIFCQHGSTEAKQYARKQITQVVRTGTHLFIFVGYLKKFGGWSRGLRKAVGNWYVEKDADQLAYQLVKYRQREGFTHRDVLRITHPTLHGPSKRALIDWTLGKPTEASELPNIVYAFDYAQRPGEDIPKILGDVKLPWEALPDTAMNDVKVWDKMLDNGVPINALMRQLSRLTQLGMLPQMGGRTDEVIATLLDKEALKKARIHPFAVLLALKTYQQGHGLRGSSTWDPTGKMVDALDEMFYACFEFVEPTGLRTMKNLDVSGSMAMHGTAGPLPMTAREVSAAMALVTARTEPNYMFTGFSHSLMDLNISPRMRMENVLRTITGIPFGRTDCALPMTEALRRGLEIDLFEIYTDNETWFGNIHPFQALKRYRQETGIDAKLVVIATAATKFSIADPRDKGMLDISGFDSAVPTLVSNFARGEI